MKIWSCCSGEQIVEKEEGEEILLRFVVLRNKNKAWKHN